MTRTVVAAVVAGLIGGSIGAAVSWKVLDRRVVEIREELSETRTIANGLRVDSAEFSSAFSEVRTRISAIEVAAVHVVERPAQAPRAIARAHAEAPAPSGHWWCYFGRECFRSNNDCVGADESRASECKPHSSAWCGGADGSQCFANHGDCFALQMPIPEYGKVPTYGRPCVEVE